MRICQTNRPKSRRRSSVNSRGAIWSRAGVAMSGGPATHRAVVLQPFPTTELYDFPKILRDVLPLLPVPLAYRLIDNDLVIRDANGDVIIAVLRDALGVTTVRY